MQLKLFKKAQFWDFFEFEFEFFELLRLKAFHYFCHRFSFQRTSVESLNQVNTAGGVALQLS